MSRFHNRNFELLEPYDAKVSRTVLRGEGSSNAPDLLDIFLDNPAETFQQFEKRTRNLQSLSRYSRANQINKEWLDQFLNEGHSRGLTPVRCHCNVLAWSDDAEQLKRIKADVGSQLATMECKPRHNTVDVPALFWAGIPGNESDFPAEESFYTYLEQALCFFVEETNYRDSPSPFGIKMVDRITGKPLHLDISAASDVYKRQTGIVSSFQDREVANLSLSITWFVSTTNRAHTLSWSMWETATKGCVH